ncbi:ECU07_1645 [Encephalitozoon cuniculi GB-M1]|uniref:rRNA-processing protein FYV7 n=1 Tax=Encephalitozoon cuniculi (strain GB-M1) TaxID=284813 RepID=A0A1T5PD42_ENCCU|nr:uncharacterized protein ECU07_1645 [Encephalitozoon cuniculi GB-M1]UYI27326.1 hypothetical protein J0A71_05g11890 [Encephalitozoon cuniculi]SKD10690.1 ECU07_1645 [Encephalitozoon cuniculi GB-M1]
MKREGENGEGKSKDLKDKRRKKTEEEIERIRAHRIAERRLYMQRTKKNQPVTSNRISLLLKQIEKLPKE